MHPEAYYYVADAVLKHGPFRNVVEFGSRDVNGSVRGLFPSARYLGIDVEPGAGVDLVTDASAYRTDQPHDAAVCCEVLEHVPNPEAFIGAAWAALAPGGCFILTTACPPRAPHSAVDGGPVRAMEFYRNVEPDLLRCWLAVFGDFEVEEHSDRGDVYATARRT